MMFDIVTAKQGKPHVTAEQQARINASAFGPGRYILDVGDGLALSMADANTLTIGSGAIMADGRVIDNEEAVSVAIANGSQAAYRRDLVVYSIETDASTGITTGELSVLHGATATTESAAKDPTYTAGNLLDGDLKATVPIARVKLAALTPTVEPLLSKVPNIASLRDSVSRLRNGRAFVWSMVVQGGGWRHLMYKDKIAERLGVSQSEVTENSVVAIGYNGDYEANEGTVLAKITGSGELQCMCTSGGIYRVNVVVFLL